MHEDETLDPAVATIAALARHPATLDDAARARVMLAVQTEILSGRPIRGPQRFGWALEPRAIRLSPLGAMAMAAGLVGIGVAVGVVGRARTFLMPDQRPAVVASVIPYEGATPAGRPVVPAGSAAAQVKFVFVAPQASEVTVVGNFNGWNPSAHPMQRTPTGGTWTVTVPLEAGRHEYSFVVNGSHWMPDPSAPLAAEDGFGAANSVLLVSGSTS
ncbi:MAG: isoamylase early set domain-containing protein [Gemmatimonadaceae bacterium]|nr:isoamylase early set domain-containing protein [Gemmatimonadaceae bacterium]